MLDIADFAAVGTEIPSPLEGYRRMLAALI
jgi:hypothetical protein